MYWKVVQVITAAGNSTGREVDQLDEVFETKEEAQKAAQKENLKLENLNYLWEPRRRSVQDK